MFDALSCVTLNHNVVLLVTSAGGVGVAVGDDSRGGVCVDRSAQGNT
jgi:hypothetical protein